jgi:hypothetical protein
MHSDASDNPSEAYTTFSDVTRLRQGISPQNVFVDWEDGGLARAATLGRLSPLHFICSIFPQISTYVISRGTWLGGATCCHPKKCTCDTAPACQTLTDASVISPSFKPPPTSSHSSACCSKWPATTISLTQLPPYRPTSSLACEQEEKD